MLETKAFIDLCLSFAGESLDFSGVSIRGIPGQLHSNVSAFSSPFDVHKQVYSFRVKTSDISDNGIKQEDKFIYGNFSRDYEFKVTDIVDTLDGWSKIEAIFMEKFDV